MQFTVLYTCSDIIYNYNNQSELFFCWHERSSHFLGHAEGLVIPCSPASLLPRVREVARDTLTELVGGGGVWVGEKAVVC